MPLLLLWFSQTALSIQAVRDAIPISITVAALGADKAMQHLRFNRPVAGAHTAGVTGR